MTKNNEFTYSEQPEPHRGRTKEILKKYPQVRSLMGRNPVTFIFILLLFLAQTGLAWLAGGNAGFDVPWWGIVLAAYLVGAFIDHSLFVLIHDASHNLIFRNKTLNTLSLILANLAQAVPNAVAFQTFHLKHHFFQGIPELDADMPGQTEAKIFRGPLGKALWFLFYPLVQISRTFRLTEIKLINLWVLTNLGSQLAYDVAVFLYFGPESFLYLVLSLFFSIGLHPLGARWIQEHYLVAAPQETYSYYGCINKIAFNVGYHNEHHDFPSVPWNRLPQIKAMAPEYYDTLYSHKSWTVLLFKFIFSPELSLFSRMKRKERGGVAINDLTAPDVALSGEK